MKTERIRGRKGMALRKARLYEQPLCQDCKAKGITRPAYTPDHIKPLAQGGTDTNDNIRCLCVECHRKRTAEQFGHKYKPRTGPDGWHIE